VLFTGTSFATAPSTACPLLGPLRNNGGPTRTQALLSTSPAIDAGLNSVPSAWDQRGVDYFRDFNATDIGAYEVQKNEIVFNGGFDACAAPI